MECKYFVSRSAADQPTRIDIGKFEVGCGAWPTPNMANIVKHNQKSEISPLGLAPACQRSARGLPNPLRICARRKSGAHESDDVGQLPAAASNAPEPAERPCSIDAGQADAALAGKARWGGVSCVARLTGALRWAGGALVGGLGWDGNVLVDLTPSLLGGTSLHCASVGVWVGQDPPHVLRAVPVEADERGERSTINAFDSTIPFEPPTIHPCRPGTGNAKTAAAAAALIPSSRDPLKFGS